MSCTYKQGLLIYWSPVHHNCLSNCQKCTSEELLNVMCNNYLYISFWSIVLHISQKLSVIKKSLQQRKNLKIFYYIHIYSETSWGFFFLFKRKLIDAFHSSIFTCFSWPHFLHYPRSNTLEYFLMFLLNFCNTKLLILNKDK